ncbi:PAS domain S-box protein [Flavobacterium circumlabens]|uniref:histidine kinase n=1 Tax=Flavobacterium circumlabens TaxID=2133765 RepID=A0A4Y7UC86_9FLAO|nr:PAS domain-containing protein [Flavobacterium circumlabens]TCN58645.1 PAS domain S-box-containing protein [Flavobacterium circumlabens]TEB44073.1 PAS domain S-box protein [Flavobacterium circumlabens]
MGRTNNEHYFLAGGGEMGEQIRAKDWSKTSLGDPENWPHSLQTMVTVMLHNPFGMYIAWGENYTQLYNDGFRPILGSGKHPQALGISSEITFSKIWEIIGPLFTDVRNGKAVSFPDFMVPLNRNGFTEECYFDFSYSPIRKEDGEVGGILVTVIETTEKKKATEALKESNARFMNNIMQAPVAMCVFRGKDYIVEIANKQMIELWGVQSEDVLSKPIFEALPETKNQYLEDVLEHVYRTGEKFTANEQLVQLPRKGQTENTYINFVYEALTEPDGSISGIVAIAIEVTGQVLARSKVIENEQKIRQLVENAPFPIAVYVGKEMHIELANESIITLWGKGNNVIGKSFKEVLPELDNQLVFEQIKNVLDTGKSFHTTNTPLDLTIEGKLQTHYFNYSLTPLYDIHGIIYGVMNTGVDLTDLNVAKKKIEESDKRFRNTVKQAPIGISILRGPDYMVEMANEAYLKLVGREEAGFVGSPLFDSLPEVKEAVNSLLEGVLKTGIPYHGYEVPIPLNRYGQEEQIFYFDFLYHPLKEENGEISGIIVTVTEVTEKVDTRKKTELNEERLNIIVEASELGTWELNVKTKDFQYSKRYIEIVTGNKNDLNLSHAQLVKHLHPDDLHIREKAFKEAFVSGYINYEARLIWEDQSIHWVEAKGKVFYDLEGQPEKLLGTVRDITEEKQYQQKIEESEKRFRNLVMKSPVPKAILKGSDLIIEMANVALLKNIWKRKESDVQGKKIFDVFPELKQQKYARLLSEVSKTGKVHSESESPIFIDGENGKQKFYIDFEYAPLNETDDTLSGIKITLIDVTEKVEARKKIEESEKRFRSLTESIPQLICETDEKGNALFASGKWLEFTGIHPKGEEEWRSIIHPDDFEENARTWSHSLATGELYRCDVRIKSKSGDYRWHTAIGEPVLDKDNTIIKWVGAFTDIQTEKAFTHELEKQVAERTKELEKNNIDLEKMNKELQSFAYISSHDLQEPLRKIQTFATQIIERESENLSEIGKDKFQRMQNAAQRMQTLINDLLSYSRTSTLERVFEKTDLSEIINEVKEDLREELEQKNATIDIIEGCELGVIPFQFRQLIYNLVSNSIKFSKPEIAPVIKIKCTIDKGKNFNYEALSDNKEYCHISISDNGIGFDQQYNTKIFEVFQRLHGRELYNGTGIGLAIVKKIAENHNGFITAQGKPNEGASFDIYIPVT